MLGDGSIGFGHWAVDFDRIVQPERKPRLREIVNELERLP